MLDSHTLKTVKEIVGSYLPNSSYNAFIFGSRVTGSNRPFSDIDLGILGPKPLPTKNYISLVQALEDSDIPYRTDVVDFASVSDRFKRQALTKTIAL
jgi:predicted nucleotidyltransferase